MKNYRQIKCPYCDKIFHSLGIARHRAVCRQKHNQVKQETMTTEEIVKIVDNSISDLSVSGAIDFLEELTGEIETRIAGLECDMEGFD